MVDFGTSFHSSSTSVGNYTTLILSLLINEFRLGNDFFFQAKIGQYSHLVFTDANNPLSAIWKLLPFLLTLRTFPSANFPHFSALPPLVVYLSTPTYLFIYLFATMKNMLASLAVAFLLVVTTHGSVSFLPFSFSFSPSLLSFSLCSPLPSLYSVSLPPLPPLPSPPSPPSQLLYYSLTHGQATRQYWQQPGTNYNIWNTPLGSDAQWGTANDADTIALRHGGFINSPDNYGSPVWVSQSASNPTAHFTGTNVAPGGDAITIDINPHLVPGSYAAGPYTQGSVDEAYNFIDTVGYPGMYLFAGPIPTQNFQAGQGPYNMPDGALGMTDATTDLFCTDYELKTGMYIQSAGVIRSYDIDPSQNDNFMPGTNIPAIRHMLRYSHDPAYLKRNDVDNANGALNPDAWPKTFEDYQGGDTPGNIYYGDLLYGTTVGIPKDTPMPQGLSTAGQQIFWTLQNYGALIRDASGGGFHLFADQDVCSNNDWLNDANNDLVNTIVPLLAPLRNQHLAGQNFADYPANGPGQRLDVGPPPLEILPGFPTPSPSNTVVQVSSFISIHFSPTNFLY
jgi:hypothetical protein